VQRASHVTLNGDLSGDYVIIEKRKDGSVVLQPDASVEAIRRRNNATPATLQEFEAEYGPMQPPDGEG
jgi:bifunctional DNA-binding transcriptional regulator/antitoxin component of YhaV-PrlF toxin-antitoxin module